jgi:hypothetical protein
MTILPKRRLRKLLILAILAAQFGGYPLTSVQKETAGPSMTDIFSNAQSAADYIRTALDLAPHIGIILGSGRGNLTNHL